MKFFGPQTITNPRLRYLAWGSTPAERVAEWLRRLRENGRRDPNNFRLEAAGAMLLVQISRLLLLAAQTGRALEALAEADELIQVYLRGRGD